MATKKIKKKKKYNLDTKIRSALRKLWFWSPERREAEKRVLIAPYSHGNYYCSFCKKVKNKKEEKLNIDHIIPAGELYPLDAFAARLFCSSLGLQAMCKSCHDKKTYSSEKS